MANTLTTEVTIDNNCTVTNNSGVDVMVLSGSTTTKTDQVYEQTLKIVPAGNENVITTAGTGTIVLNDTHVDKNGVPDQPNTLYDLIMVKSGNLFPVKLIQATLSYGIERSFSPITISADDAKNMTLAETFWQTIMAFPTVKLSTDFAAASKAATDTPTSDTKIDATVNAFFKTTQKYQSLTNDMVVAIHTYYKTYPYVWAGYGTSKTYYLYNSDGSKVTYAGSVELKMPATTTASIDKNLPGVTITYTNASNKQINLYYNNGLFVDDLSADIPTVSLKGLFTLKSTLTKVPADNAVIAVLCGTVNSNQTVLGYNEKLKPNPDGSWSGMYTMLHPKDGMGYLQLFMAAMGVTMGIEVLVKGVKALKNRFKKQKVEEDGGVDPSPTEIDQIKAEWGDMKALILESNQKLLDKMNDGQKVAEDMNASISELQQKITDRFNEDQRTSLTDSLNNEGKLLDNAGQYQVTNEMQDIGDSIQDNMVKLDNATTSDLATVAPEVKANVAQINVDLKAEVDQVASGVEAEVQQEFETAETNLKTAEDTADTIDQKTKETEEGSTPENMEFESKVMAEV